MIEYSYGFLIGLIVAGSGAWKDTLYEPFELTKFFRSPIIVSIWYWILLSTLVNEDIILILLSSCALERLTVETWKAIIRKPPGKFQSPTKDRGWLLDRIHKQ